MIQLEQIQHYFPPLVRENPAHQKYMLKEYIQLQILDFLATTSYIRKISFIGGTSLHLIKGIDRFSEDLDFDCKGLSHEEFIQMTEDVLVYLQRFGMNVEVREKPSDKLTAFRRNLHFPGLLHTLGLSGHKDEKFLIKLESKDQQVPYKPKMVNIKGCGFYFPFPYPGDEILCAMKIAALLSRQKGRDFYDTMFLLGQTNPDYAFLSARCGVNNLTELKGEVTEMLTHVDLQQKSKDFEHLLFQQRNSKRILSFDSFISDLKFGI